MNFELLLQQLQSSNNDERLMAVQALVETESLQAVEPLIQSLQDVDAAVRFFAADGLGKLGDKRAFDPLVNVLGDADARVRGYAALSLGKLKDERALIPLIRTLYDRDNFVRTFAATGLGLLGDPRAVRYLREMLYSERAVPEAAITLITLGDKKAEHVIYAIKLFPGSGWGALLGTLERLGEIGKKSVLDALTNEDQGIRRAGFQALVWFIKFGNGDKELRLLKAALTSPDPDHRLLAIKTLGELKTEKVLPLLLQIRDNDPVEKVRKVANQVIETLNVNG